MNRKKSFTVLLLLAFATFLAAGLPGQPVPSASGSADLENIVALEAPLNAYHYTIMGQTGGVATH